MWEDGKIEVEFWEDGKIVGRLGLIYYWYVQKDLSLYRGVIFPHSPPLCTML